jgi:hypothetical protein
MELFGARARPDLRTSTKSQRRLQKPDVPVPRKEIKAMISTFESDKILSQRYLKFLQNIPLPN